MKIVTILGARPQFIKAGSVSRAITEHNQSLVDSSSFLDTSEDPKHITEVIIHTGQHFDANMSNVFFEEMKIPKPHYNLDINGLSHGAMTGQMLEKIEAVLIKENPEWVLVYGDTNSTLAGALAASKLHIKVAHVEAGLRSFNMNMPEEINRILTDRISTVLFCPTQSAIDNLEREGYDSHKIHIVKSGDVMQDGAIFYSHLATKPKMAFEDNYILATVHRAENTDDLERLNGIIDALNKISKKIQIILPLHPRTRTILKNNNIKTSFTTIDPVGYLEMVYLIKNSAMIMTDSGGLQKEAFFFEKPCITLRDETEWIELVENKFNVLAGADKNKILDLYNNDDFNHHYCTDLYGSGKASNTIVKELLK